MSVFNTYYKCVTSRSVCILVLLFIVLKTNATNYIVNTKTLMQTRMNTALPGDTIIVANGTYNWGAINITNNNGTPISAWIVLKAQTFNGVVFTGRTYLQFSGKHILINGFKFANGNAGDNDVIQFRDMTNTYASYCRITNITVVDYNSDTTGSYLNTGNKNGTDTLNKWVTLYGTHNRIDHCSFYNKTNGDPTIVVVYDSTTYPAIGTSTYHRIDSNYFKKRGYQGANEGEVIRVGVGGSSRSNGYNIIEYNLFEDGVELDPEVISNKSNYKTYRYNTFRNHAGGITLRQGKYCNVYGNIFLHNAAAATNLQYGIRAIDKGHKIFNNYIEGINSNLNDFGTMRCPIILLNGTASGTDTTTLASYSPADSCIVAFNTIVNCMGGAGIVIGFSKSGSNTFQPKGIVLANNVIKMSNGQAAIEDTAGSKFTNYFAEGNYYSAPNGLGLSATTGFSKKTLTFTKGNDSLLIPSSNVQDAAVNTSKYISLLNGIDMEGKIRSAVYDVGCFELNSTGGSVINTPLDSNVVGAGKPVVTLPVELINFNAELINHSTLLSWLTGNEINVNNYTIQASIDAIRFKEIGTIIASNKKQYYFTDVNPANGLNYYRLKIIDENGSYKLSEIKAVSLLNNDEKVTLFPNPAQQFFTVSFKQNSYINTEIVLADITGRIIQKTNILSPLTTINLQNLEKGIYIIQIKENGKIINTQKLIVTK